MSLENPNTVETTAEQTFTGVYEKDIKAATTLDQVTGLVMNIGAIEKSKGRLGIDETGANFMEDIAGNIDALAAKKRSGQSLTEEDFQTVTRQYGIRDKVRELLSA